MTHTFSSLGLNPELLSTLDELGYSEPTPIQAESIPHLLAGQDVIGQAQTGTGKTAAFTLPMLQQLKGDDLQMLVLAPTRELAIQVAEAVYRYGNKLGIRVLPIYGGESYERQRRRLQKGVHVVVGTPGRTLDLIRQRVLKLHDVRHVVLDEADEMLNMGFIEDVEAILSATNAERQTVLFSATFNASVRKLAENYMNNPLRIVIEAEEVTNEHISQRYYMVDEKDKLPALCRLLEVEPDQQNTLIFTRTRVGAAELATNLVERGFPAIAIHGDLAQNERERILRRFREGQLRILVGTDVVGRGMDIIDVSHVVNFDIPQLAIEYVHRIGRTGRAGRDGQAITFITPRQRNSLRQIENYIQKPITKAKLPSSDDVLNRREYQFTADLVSKIEATTEPDAMMHQLVEMGFSLEQITSALLGVLREQTGQNPVEEIRSVQEKPDRYERNGRNDRRSNSSDGGSGRRDRNKGGRQSHEAGMVRLIMQVGRSNGIKPGEVVATVASNANIPGSAIGAIKIEQDRTYVDVPEAHVKAVLSGLKTGKIRGRSINLDRA